MLKVSLDIDGVLYPWQEVVWEYLKTEIGIKDTYDYFWTDGFSKLSDMFQDNLFKTEHLCERRKADPEIVKLMRELAKDVEFYYVTSRPKEVKFVTGKWLRKNNFPYTYNLHLVEDKKHPIIINGIDIHVDDRVEHLDMVGKYCTGYLITQPWNEYYEYEFRYANVKDFLNMLKETKDEWLTDKYNYAYSDFLYDSYRERGRF